MSEFKIADSVWHRVVNCVQEAMIVGVDVSDLLRQIRVTVDASDQNALVLAPAYERQVREMHTKMLEQAKQLQSQRTDNKFIIDPTDKN